MPSDTYLKVGPELLTVFPHSSMLEAEKETWNETKSAEYQIPSSKVHKNLMYHLYTIWLFTRSDLKTIIFTQTTCGISSALAGPSITTNFTPDLLRVLSRLPLVLCWNWLNLIIFNIANQRLPNSVLEDSINKPWRPLPSKRLSPAEARRCLLITAPCNLILLFFIGGFKESVAMVVLTWMYNNLGGADEHYILRNLINACGFTCHASGSSIIASGSDHDLTTKAKVWIGIIGAIVFSSLQYRTWRIWKAMR